MIEVSTITCPKCGHQAVEKMPTDACQFFYDCKGCGERLKPKPGDCCVYCSYGSVPCPPMQTVRSEGTGPTQRRPAKQLFSASSSRPTSQCRRTLIRFRRSSPSLAATSGRTVAKSQRKPEACCNRDQCGCTRRTTLIMPGLEMAREFSKSSTSDLEALHTSTRPMIPGMFGSARF